MAGADPPEFPEALGANLRGFRASMRRTKLSEAGLFGLLVLLGSFLVALWADRGWETGEWQRAALFYGALGAAVAVLVAAVRRWVLRHRDLMAVATEIGATDAAAGDRLLGVFELTRDRAEYRRSPELVRAAVAQGDRDYGARDLSGALPRSRHRGLALVALLPVGAVVAALVVQPEATANAFARWAHPFGGIPRYTSVRLAHLESTWFLPLQEEFEVGLELAGETSSRPEEAELRWSGGTVRASIQGGHRYGLGVPPLGEPETALLVIGDLREDVRLEPRRRAEVEDAAVVVHLPDYLELPEPRERDARGGMVTVVEGSTVTGRWTISRPLRSLRVAPHDGTETSGTMKDATYWSDSLPMGVIDVEWVDELGLEGPRPFTLHLRTRPDERPTVALTGASGEVVLLESRTLSLRVVGTDDFGVRSMGLQWEELRAGMDPEALALDPPLRGEKVLTAGAPGDTTLEAAANFQPRSVQLGSGFFELRAWAKDARPGAEPSLSSPVRVRIMTADEHLEWTSQRLERWTQSVVELRDVELGLLAENRELLELDPEELQDPGTRARLEAQAKAETQNAGRLAGLVAQGQEMLREAAQNERFEAAELEEWAESMEKLEEVAKEDMESVASNLGAAARAPTAKGPAPKSPTAQGPRPERQENPVAKALADAIQEQEALLEAFEDVTGEIEAVLASLENSTFIRRLLAAAEAQSRTARDLDVAVEIGFGSIVAIADEEVLEASEKAARRLEVELPKLNALHADLTAFRDRLDAATSPAAAAFERVARDWEALRPAVVADLVVEGAEGGRPGEARASADFLSDTLNRWATELQGPSAEGEPSEEGGASLPPTIVLELLRLTEAETDLRELTREASQQAQAVDAGVLAPEDLAARLVTLGGEQRAIGDRAVEIHGEIQRLIDAGEALAAPLETLEVAMGIMVEVEERLLAEDPGPGTLAAETEIIELLLGAQKGGKDGKASSSGPGARPGEGSGGTDAGSALALVGRAVGADENIQGRDVSRETRGDVNRVPVELRAALDRYFQGLEAAGGVGQ